MKKIAILGGAFDPIHVGHYLVATQVKEKLKMDEVWFMVCYSYFPEFPDKLKRITTYKDRLAMAKLWGNDSITISRFEEKYNKRSRTIDTLKLLKKKYPRNEFYWIIGSDALPTFHLWNKWESIIKDYNVVIFPRDTDFQTLKKRVLTSFRLKEIPPNITVMNGDLIVSTVSSTHIRNRITERLPIQPLVGEKVNRFIKMKKLYVR